jgi:hypothetical protein
MQRRKYLAALGSLAAGGAAIGGTGAVDRTTASRSMTVNVVGDGAAETAIRATSEYASFNGDGALQLNLPRLNPNADHEFYDLFTIVNNSDDSLGVFVDNAGPAASQSREQAPDEANLYDEVTSSLGTAQHGWFDEDLSAGKINQPEAMPSAYRSTTPSGAPNSNSINRSWNPASDPYILQSGNSITPDWYIFETGPSGGSVTGTLDVWLFSQEFAQVAEKGP